MVPRLLKLEDSLQATQSAFLFGPRGVGKTFLTERFVAQQSRGRSINLLHLDTYRRYLTNPDMSGESLRRRNRSSHGNQSPN